MRRVLVASHGRLAAGMKESVSLIAGEQDSLDALCAYVDGIDDVHALLQDRVDAIGEGDELVIVTDVLGGSVNNEAVQFANVPGVYVVTGMSLPFVLSLVIDSSTPTQELIDQTIEEARQQLVQVKPLPTDEGEEDF